MNIGMLMETRNFNHTTFSFFHNKSTWIRINNDMYRHKLNVSNIDKKRKAIEQYFLSIISNVVNVSIFKNSGFGCASLGFKRLRFFFKISSCRQPSSSFKQAAYTALRKNYFQLTNSINVGKTLQWAS